jgi:hypothetical protein
MRLNSHPALTNAFAYVRSLKIEYRRKRNVGGSVTAEPGSFWGLERVPKKWKCSRRLWPDTFD